MKKSASDNSFGTASVVLGIISIAFSSMIGVLLGIIGLIFAFNQSKIEKNKWAKAGKILNIIGVLLGIVAIVIFSLYSDSLGY
jgi:drug/metabolite transporter (DMT)-like permease